MPWPQADLLELTIDEFLLSPQELTLRKRHGVVERELSQSVVGENARRLVQQTLCSRKLECHVRFRLGDLVFKLASRGIYEHEGRLCRIVYLSRNEAAARRASPLPNELDLIELAGWVAQQHFATPPLALRLYYHVFDGSGPEAQICESWYREFSLRSDAEMRTLVVERAHRISEALKRADENLPECTLEERHATEDAPYRKCRDYCPARAHCRQIKRHYDKETARSVANEKFLAGIVAEPKGSTFEQKKAQRRKQQISMMLTAGNFFEVDFPREVFRKLILEEAEDETVPPEKRSAYREMGTWWSDADFVAWRAWLDRQE
jgi:hypothetical protein